MQVAPLAQRDELVHQRLQLFGFRQRGGDLLVLDQRRGHVAEHRATVGARLVELATGITVAHVYSPRSFSRRAGSILILQFLRQFLDILRRPVGDMHTKMQTHLRQERTEERRGGKECGSTGRSWRWAYHKK